MRGVGAIIRKIQKIKRKAEKIRLRYEATIKRIGNSDGHITKELLDLRDAITKTLYPLNWIRESAIKTRIAIEEKQKTKSPLK